MAVRKWTDEQREQQAKAIHQWKPWQLSTGAKTLEGKAVVSQNAALGATKKKVAINQATIEFFAALDRLAKLTEKRGGFWCR